MTIPKHGKSIGPAGRIVQDGEITGRLRRRSTKYVVFQDVISVYDTETVDQSSKFKKLIFELLFTQYKYMGSVVEDFMYLDFDAEHLTNM